MADFTELAEKLQGIRRQILEGLSEVRDSRGVYEYRKGIMDGKAGLVGSLMREMGRIPAENRAEYGRQVNELKSWVTERFDELDARLKAAELEARYVSEKIDVTEPEKTQTAGNLHPITQVTNELIDIFTGMGFSVYEGSEIENDYYNFEALNMPKNHPARDMQDTFYISGDVVLRTHTSPVQVRTMLKQRPPVRVIVPGTVYRRDSDLTHSPMFHQVEGLLVDRHVTFADLKGTLKIFLERFFNSNISIRFRPSFFPFTEPSAEVDISCVICGGKGCRVCKDSGWLEILGCGMVDPAVYGAVDYDASEVTGFAFGMGLERLCMLKNGIGDLRLFFDNDIRFLRQFA